MTWWKDRKVRVRGTTIVLAIHKTTMSDRRIFLEKSYDEAYPERFRIDQDEAEPLIRALIDIYELPIKVVATRSKKEKGGRRKARERALVESLKDWVSVGGLPDEARKAHIYAAIDTALKGDSATCSSRLCEILCSIVEAVEEDERGTSGT